MAASKKNAKGSKTAHVLNLLTAPDAPKEGAAGEEAAAETSPEQTPPAAHSRPLLPPILEVAQANDNDLAQQIQHALEEELEETPGAEPAAPPEVEQSAQSIVEEVSPVATEQTPAAPAPSGAKMSQDEIEKLLPAANAPAEAPAPEPAPAPQPAPAAPASSGAKMNQDEIEKLLAAANAPAEAPAPEPAPAPQPAPAAPASSGAKMNQDEIEKLLAAANAPAEAPAPEPAPAPQPAPEPAPAPQPAPEPPAAKPAPQPEEEEEEEVTYTNVMQVLVEEKAPRYIEKFGLCTCKHCAADVKALTLSNLVPKYVVLSRLDRIPMLTVYEGRYSTTIFAQLTRACKIVMDHPHHSRE